MTDGRTYFVSDLHLFTSRSDGPRHLERIRALAAGANAFVLGGDIFDFRWTMLDSVGDTVDAAAQWLAELAQSCPSCQFYFLLGNHDHHGQFIEALDGLQEAQGNLAWHPYFVRLGNSLFLHGDAADYTARRLSLEHVRAKTLEVAHEKRGPAAQFFYDMFVNAGLHRPLPFIVYPKRGTARRLLSYVEEIGHGVDTGLEHVYFGHTHRELCGYEFRGIRFHNGGAPMKGVRFRVVEAEVAAA